MFASFKSLNETEALPLTPALRLVIDYEHRRRNEIILPFFIGSLLLGIPVALGASYYYGGGLRIIFLLGAATGPLIFGTLLVRIRLAARRRANQQTYLRSTGAATLIVHPASNDVEESYKLAVGGWVVPLPNNIDLSIFGVSFDNRGVPINDGRANRVVGTVEYDTDCTVVFKIANEKGETLYQHPDLPLTH